MLSPRYSSLTTQHSPLSTQHSNMSSQTEKEAPHLRLRALEPGDEAFLYSLYCSTRSDEIDGWGLAGPQREIILELQFRARERHYDIAFPHADHRIILVDELPAGRIMVFRSAVEIRLVDVALLPAHRGRGIGESLVRSLCDEAASAGKPVTLHVTKSNRAARLYERMGFRTVDDIGTDYKMEWRA